MKIQSINPQISAQRTSYAGKAQKMNSNVSFRSYQSIMKNVASTRFGSAVEVAGAFQKLYIAMEKEGKVVDVEAKKVLDDFFAAFDTVGFLKKMSLPIREMEPRLRDLSIRSEQGDIVAMRKNKDNSLTVCNFGKRGFFSAIFDIQSARQDCRLIYRSGDNKIEFGITDENGFLVEQSVGPFWAKSKYSPIVGEEIYHKEGDRSSIDICF